MNIKKRLKNRKIGVLYGGISAEREISLLSGKAVISALKQEGFNVVGIDVGRNAAEQIKKAKIDFAYITLHGPWGEDGTIQGLLEIMGVPYSGCGVLASALSMNKIFSKRIFDAEKIPNAPWVTVYNNQKVKVRKFPVVVKPSAQGSALGVSIARNRKDLAKALKDAFKYGDEALVEKYISGTEITVGVLGNKPLPVIEIVPKGEFYDFKSKYQPGQSSHIIPARIPRKAAKEAQSLALKVFHALGCRVLGRVDMILDKNNKLWVLEMNTLPGMTNTSLLPDEAKEAGLSFSGLILKIIEHSLSGSY